MQEKSKPLIEAFKQRRLERKTSESPVQLVSSITLETLPAHGLISEYEVYDAGSDSSKWYVVADQAQSY